MKNRIYIVSGHKGGVGKTHVGLVVAEMFRALGKDYYLVDADAATPNVGLTYAKEIYESFLSPSKDSAKPVSKKGKTSTEMTRQIVFTENVRKQLQADDIFEMVRQKDVLVVLPANVDHCVAAWLQDNNILEVLSAPDSFFDIVFFFVTNGSQESIDLFFKSIEATEKRIPHVMVKNRGASTPIDWSSFDIDSKVASFLSGCGFVAIEFPELLIQEELHTKILKEYISFDKVLNDKEISFPAKNRIKSFLKLSTQAIASTGYIQEHPDYKLAKIEQVAA